MSKDLYKAYIALGVVSFFWGTTYIAARVGVRHMPGLFVSGLRQLISGSILVSFFLIKGHHFPGREILKKISVQSIFLLCIANGLLTWSLEFINGGLAAVIAALVPLFIALFTVWLSKCAKISRWMLIGLIVGFAGVLIIFMSTWGIFRADHFLSESCSHYYPLYHGRSERCILPDKSPRLIFYLT